MYWYSRGDVYLIAEGQTQGNEIQKTRPWVVVSATDVNQTRPTIIAVPLSTHPHSPLKVKVLLKEVESFALLDQVRTFDKSRVIQYKGSLQPEEMTSISAGLSKILGVETPFENPSFNHYAFFRHQQLYSARPKNLLIMPLDYTIAPQEQILSTEFKNCSYAMTVLPNGQLVTGAVLRDLQVWDMDQKICIKTLSGHQEEVQCLITLPNGYVVSGSKDKTLRVWDITEGTCISILKGHKLGITALVALSNNIVVSASDSTLRVWDIDREICVKTLQQTQSITTLVALPEGQIMSGDWAGVLSLWDIEQGKCIKILALNEGTELGAGSVSALLMLANGQLLASYFFAGMCIWDIKNGVPVKRLSESSVNKLALLPNDYVVSGSIGDYLKIWDMNQQGEECIQTLRVPAQGWNNQILALTVLSNGQVVTSSNNGTQRIWLFPEKSVDSYMSPTNCTIL